MQRHDAARLGALRVGINIFPLIFFTLVGCASFDPNNIILRHGVTQEEQTPVPTAWNGVPGEETRLAAFDFVWNTINERYYDPNLNGAHWSAARKRYLPSALAAQDDEAFWDVLDKMAGELKDSHTRVESPQRVKERRRYENQTLGLAVTLLAGKLVVTRVNGASDAWWAGVRPGMIVRNMDGEEAVVAFQRLLDSTRSASTQQARLQYAIGKLNRGAPGSSVSMTFERADGSLISATLKRRLVYFPPQVLARRLPSGLGYISFNHFLPSLSGQVHAALQEYHDAPGIIVDLRNNGGGSLDVANGLLDAFFKDKVTMSTQITRTGRPITLAWGLVKVIKMEYHTTTKQRAYSGAVAILMNAGSASASELFSAAMQDHGRAVVVGETSCGCLLGYLGYANIPGGGELAYSEIGFISPKGRRIEGAGVVPDKLAPLTQADLQLSRDHALEEAQEMLKAEIDKKKLAVKF